MDAFQENYRKFKSMKENYDIFLSIKNNEELCRSFNKGDFELLISEMSDCQKTRRTFFRKHLLYTKEIINELDELIYDHDPYIRLCIKIWFGSIIIEEKLILNTITGDEYQHMINRDGSMKIIFKNLSAEERLEILNI